jgi:hypothetical protein
VAADIGSIPGSSGQLLYNNAGTIGAEDPVVSGPDAVAAAPTKNPVQIGCLFLTTPATITNNQVGEAQCDSTQHLFVNVTNASIPVTGTFWQTTQPVSGTFWQTTQPVSCTAANCLFNLAQWGGTALGTPTNFGTAPGAVIAGSVNASLFVGTTAAVASAAGVQEVGIVGHAGANIDGAAGAAPPANVIYVGGLGSGATGGDLIGLPVGDTYKAINISTATTTLIVTGVSGRQVRISAQHMIAAAADNVAWIEGTGATCGTGTAGMAGGTTAASGYNFAANGGIAEGSGLGTVLQTITTGDSVCLVTSAAVQLSGGIEYTIY